jgi:hypothetical protein
MNTDDFEKRLQRQDMRPIPREWRGGILDAASRAGDHQLSTLRSKANAEDGSTLNPQPTSWWRELLWPCPQAWAGLAAAWVLILGLNAATREPVQVATAQSTPPAREVLMALKERRRLLAELAGLSVQVEPQKPAAPRPRSQLSQRTFTG